MVYVSDRCVLDQLTAGAHEEKLQGVGVFSCSFRKIHQFKNAGSLGTGGKQEKKKTWDTPMVDLKTTIDTVRVFGKYFVTVLRKKGHLGVCSQEPEMLGQIFTDANGWLKLLSTST